MVRLRNPEPPHPPEGGVRVEEARASAFALTEYAPSQARHWLIEDSDLGLDPSDPIVLLLSELVTNSVVHGGHHDGDRVEVTVRRSPKAIRVEVRDPGPGFELPDVLREQHGLQIVQELADQWGISAIAPTTVWFEIKADGG